MFNEKSKLAFVQTLSNTDCQKDILMTFEKAAEFEKRYRKDLSEWNEIEVMSFYRYLNTCSIDRLMLFSSMFARYTEYIQEKQPLFRNNVYRDISSANMLALCIDRNGTRFVTRKELKALTDKLQNPLEKYLFWALFDGLKGKEFCEITELKWTDVNLREKTAKLCTGRTVKVSDELIMYAKESKETDIYWTYAVSENQIIDPGYRRMEGDIWKTPIRKNSVGTTYTKGVQAYRLLARCNNYLEIPQKYNEAKYLRDCGLLEYAIKLSLEYKIPLIDVFYEHIDELNSQYEFTKQKRSNYLAKFGIREISDELINTNIA